jgi:cation-transporting P-type ATPase E
LDTLSESDFNKEVLDKLIFSRLKPEHKLRIIKCLKSNKIYTAMIGDGVNDLPAIKEADLGIAMEEGSQITKEISDIVLLKNKFSLLPRIFEEGNKIINTVGAVAKLFLTKNFLVIFLSLFSLFFMWDFPLTPRRVSLINIFTIGLPAFIIALKNNNSSRNSKFSVDLFSFVLISSFILTISSYLGTYYTKIFFTPNHEDLQLIMLTTLIFTSVSNFLSVTLEKSNKGKITFLIYGSAILTIYVFLILIKQGGIIIRGLKSFYEISQLQSDYWWTVVIISLASSIGLFLIQKIRNRLVWNEWR